MRRRGIDLAIILIIGLTAISTNVEASDEDISDLSELISSFDDPRMTSYDLAFYLASHGYDAVPEDGCVVLVLKGSTYSLIPNGDGLGLCDVELKTSN